MWKVFIPSGGKKDHDNPALFYNKDYAVLELKEQHDREWMEFGVNDADTGTVVQALGYPSSTQDYQVFATCPISQQTENYIYNFCKIYEDITGSPLYISEGTEEKPRIIGIFTSAYFVVNGWEKVGSVASALTQPVVQKIRKFIRHANCAVTDEDE